MKTISIFQIIILIAIILLLITDFSKLKKKTINLLKNINNVARKKGN